MVPWIRLGPGQPSRDLVFLPGRLRVVSLEIGADEATSEEVFEVAEVRR